MNDIHLKIISLGSGTESIESKNMKGKYLVLNRSFLQTESRKNFGLGFICFGPNVQMQKIHDATMAFRIEKTAKGVTFLNCFRIVPESQEPYFLVTVDSKQRIQNGDIFTCKDSFSMVISYAFIGDTNETILLLKNFDTVRIDGKYFIFSHGQFRKSTLQNDCPVARFVKNTL